MLDKVSDNPYKKNAFWLDKTVLLPKCGILGDWLQNRRGEAGFRPYSVVAMGFLKKNFF
jgi:hypothetical protein